MRTALSRFAPTRAYVALGIGGDPAQNVRLALIAWGVSFAIGALTGWVPALATVHGLAMLACGLLVALSAQRTEVVATFAFAVASSGVYWRMHEAQLPYEGAKYGACAILVLYLLRRRRSHESMLPLAYLVLLFPAVLLTLEALPVDVARRTLIFNLAGPALLGLFLLVLGGFRVGRLTRVRWLIALGTGCFLVLGTLARARFAGGAATYVGVNSNFTASGGFGPNQVSSVLGAGSVILIGFLLNARLPRLAAALGLLVAQGFLAFALITLSRGGVYSALLSLAVLFGYLVLSRRPMPRGGWLAILMLVCGLLATIPFLESETTGMLSRRYSAFHVTGRDRRAAADLEAMVEHPVLGRGVGMGRHEEGYLTHSEATRMLGDHGFLGLLALVVIGAIGLRGVFRSAPGVPRATSLLVFTWAITFTLHAAVRIAMPAAMFAFGACCLLDQEEDVPPTPPAEPSA